MAAATGGSTCDSLSKLSLPNVTITSAQSVAAKSGSLRRVGTTICKPSATAAGTEPWATRRSQKP
jgi:hypothetical protein